MASASVSADSDSNSGHKLEHMLQLSVCVSKCSTNVQKKACWQTYWWLKKLLCLLCLVGLFEQVNSRKQSVQPHSNNWAIDVEHSNITTQRIQSVWNEHPIYSFTCAPRLSMTACRRANATNIPSKLTIYCHLKTFCFFLHLHSHTDIKRFNIHGWLAYLAYYSIKSCMLLSSNCAAYLCLSLVQIRHLAHTHTLSYPDPQII